jgi:hypothetical protein
MNKKIYISIILSVFAQFMFAQIPMLNSTPTATAKVIFLDFDGQQVYGTNWNSAFSTPTINAAASGLTPAGMTEVWKRVSEDYIPFNVNVTTDVAKFNAANSNGRIRVIVTPTSAWFAASCGTAGVAYVGSFSWGNDTPVWVFENCCSMVPKNVAEAAAHETGHSLSLLHQSIYNSSCVKTNEYHPGQGSGVTSWVPIMGSNFSQNVSVWYNGTNSSACTTIQNDHGSTAPYGITKTGMLSYRTDDVGDTYPTAKLINLTTNHLIDSGIISQPTDVDVYQFSLCNSRYVTFNIRPYALDSTSYSGADLDVNFKLYDGSNNLLLTTAPIASLNALSAMNLSAGNYYFVIDGDLSANYSDYGSLGRYYVDVYSNNVPSFVSAFNCISNTCAGAAFTATDQSSGSPNAWSWTVSGPSPTVSSQQNPIFSLNNAGTYTITLSASNATSASCPVSKVITIYGIPTVALAASPGTVCANSQASVICSGASAYTVVPAPSSTPNFSTFMVYVSASTVFTVTGNSFGCSSSNTVLVSTMPLPTITVNANPTIMCTGQPATLTANGAVSYTWSATALPGWTVAPQIVYTPTFAFACYTVGGTAANGCNNWITVCPPVVASPTLSTAFTPTSACAGQPFTLTATGASAYTWNPGPSTGSSVVVSPTANIIYTVSGTNNTCTSISSVSLSVIPLPSLTVGSYSICNGSSVNVVANGATTYTWNTTATTSSINVSPTVTTMYTVTGTTGSCSATKISTVNVNNMPTVTVNSGSVCAGNPIILTASTALSYSWSTSATTNTISVSPMVTTVYTVTGSNGACIQIKTATVTALALPTVSMLASSQTVCTGGAVISLSGTPSGGVFTGTGVTGSTFIPPSNPGNYVVSYNYTDPNTTCSNSNTLSITVSDCTGLDEIAKNSNATVYPNPNAGKFILEVGNVGNYVLEIYNALGQKVLKQNLSEEKMVIDLGENANGIYIVKINLDQNRTITKKIVVSRN